MIPIRSLLAASSLALFGACAPLTVDQWLEREFTVDVPAGGNTALETTKTFNLAEVSDLKGQLQYVKEITVPEVQLAVSNVTSANATKKVSGQVLVMADASSSPTVLADYKDLAVADGAKQALALDVAPQKAVLAPILKGASAQVKFTGNLDAVPAQFKVKARIHVVASFGL
jgi:hypothetical protein